MRGRSSSQRTPQSSQRESGSRGSRKTQSQDADSGKKKAPPKRQQQPSVSQYFESPASKVPPIAEDQVTEQARNVVYFLVSSAKEGNVISRGDIQKGVLNNFHTKHYPTIMKAAAEILDDVFGMKMLNLDGEPEKYDKLILVDRQSMPKEVEDEEEKKTQTLLLLILNTVQVAGDYIKEEQLLKFLAELQISYSKNDLYFGDVEGKINSFKSQSYLKFEMDKSTIPPTKLIMLGPRAKAEVNTYEMLTFSKKLYPDLAFMSDAAEKASALQDTEDDGEEDEENQENVIMV